MSPRSLLRGAGLRGKEGLVHAAITRGHDASNHAVGIVPHRVVLHGRLS